jgi:hypothetical protein
MRALERSGPYVKAVGLRSGMKPILGALKRYSSAT